MHVSSAGFRQSGVGCSRTRAHFPASSGPAALKLEVDTSAPTVAKISLNVPKDEFEKEVQSGLRSVSGNVRKKGFRPGKIPVKLLEKEFGEDVRKQVKENFLQQAYGQAVEENELKPIAHPRLAPENLEMSEDGSFSVDFEVPLKPTFELPEYKGLTATSELEPVMDEQIDTTIDELRQGQSTPEPAGDEGLEESGFVVANISFHHEGESVFDREDMRLNTVSVPPGVDAEAFAEGLKGAKAGDDIEFPMELPDFLEKEEIRGEQGICKIHVTECMKLVPPTDEKLVETLGDEVTDMDSLRKFVAEKLGENAQERENHRIETDLLDRVLDMTEVELPETMVAQQAEARLQQLQTQMEGSGSSEEDIAKAKEDEAESARAEAAKGLKALLVVESIGEKEELLVSNDDIETELAGIAMRNQTAIDEVREYYSKNNLGQQLAIEILEKKVRRFLRENADVQSPA